jgi:peptide/nickel transport system permease protein
VTIDSRSGGSLDGLEVAAIVESPLQVAGVEAGRSVFRLGQRHPVSRFLVVRIAAGIATLFIVSILIFAGTQVLPGDVATAILGRNATPSAVAALRQQLHLDRPPVVRYGDWLTGVLRGDLGQSGAGQAEGAPNAPISSLIGGRLANSAILALCTIVLLIPLGLLLGIVSATRAGSALDHVISTVTLAAISLPEFVIGTLAILVFASWAKVLPPVSLIESGKTPFDTPSVLVLPTFTLLAASLAATVRMVRAGMLEALRADYVQMARLNGFSEQSVVIRYALRNALAPTVQVIALNIQWLVGGIVVTEYVFGFPGIGQALVQAVSIRDVTFVQSVGLLIAVVYIVLNIISDLAVVFLDPKLRTSL